MNTSIRQSLGAGPLFIDFNRYTDGDTAFKKELIFLMIENLRELQQALRFCAQDRDLSVFQRACHKVKPTLSMLDDPNLLAIVEVLKSQADVRGIESKIDQFNALCESIVKGLETEYSR